MNDQRTGSRYPGWLLTVLPYAVLSVFLWFAYGVVRRITGGTGKILGFRYGDFFEFYSGADALLKGTNIYEAGRLGYIYPPLLAFLLAPLSMLPIDQAAWLWLAVKIGLLAACGWWGAAEIQQRLAQPRDRASLLMIVLSGMLLDMDKLRTEMNMQQSNMLVLLCFVLALRWLDRRPLLSGLVLGFGANIKYLTLIALPYLIVRKRFKAAAATVAGSAFWALLPATVLGWDRNIEFLRYALGGLVNLVSRDSAATGAAKVMGPEAGMSITAFAARYFSAGQHSAASISVAGTAALLYILAVWGIYRSTGTPFLRGRGGLAESRDILPGVVALEWAGLIVFALAFSPQTGSPHLSILLLPCLAAAGVLLMPRQQISGLPLIAGLLIMFAGLVLPYGHDNAARWHHIAGPIWCILTMYLTLLWTGLRRLKAQI